MISIIAVLMLVAAIAVWFSNRGESPAADAALSAEGAPRMEAAAITAAIEQRRWFDGDADSIVREYDPLNP